MMVTGVFANKPWDAKTFETWQLASNSNANALCRKSYYLRNVTFYEAFHTFHSGSGPLIEVDFYRGVGAQLFQNGSLHHV